MLALAVALVELYCTSAPSNMLGVNANVVRALTSFAVNWPCGMSTQLNEMPGSIARARAQPEAAAVAHVRAIPVVEAAVRDRDVAGHPPLRPERVGAADRREVVRRHGDGDVPGERERHRQVLEVALVPTLVESPLCSSVRPVIFACRSSSRRSSLVM